jgi:hypothetical protein
MILVMSDRLYEYIPPEKILVEKKKNDLIHWLQNSGIICCDGNRDALISALRQYRDIPRAMMKMNHEDFFRLLMESGSVCSAEHPQELVQFLLERDLIWRKNRSTLIRLLKEGSFIPSNKRTKKIVRLLDVSGFDKSARSVDIIRFLQEKKTYL